MSTSRHTYRYVQLGFAAVLGIAIGVVGSGVPGLVPSASSESGQTSSASSSSALSAEMLSAFAEAYPEVTRLRTTFQPRIAMSQDAEQAELLRKEQQRQVNEVIQQAGLTRKTYDRIFDAFNSDEEIRAKVTRLLVQ